MKSTPSQTQQTKGLNPEIAVKKSMLVPVQNLCVITFNLQAQESLLQKILEF